MTTTTITTTTTRGHNNTTFVPVTPDQNEPPAKRRRQITLDTLSFSGGTVSTSVPVEPVNLTVSALMFQWYKDKLYLVPDSIPQHKRDVVLLLSKVVAYGKTVLAEGTTIPTMPSPLNRTEYSQWEATMRDIAIQVDDKLYKLIRKPENVQYNPNLQRAGKRKAIMTGVQLNKIPAANFDVVNVVDNVCSDFRRSPIPGVQCLHYDKIDNFRLV